MAPTESSRQLAAILFTDIAGYTTMMQRDEKRALEAVRKHHQTLETIIPQFHGFIQQYYGDGSLSIFNSATDGVRCALELQKHLLREPEVPVRMGLHIGEIYTEAGKVFGDGVNIASRIESIGQPGTVLFSREVYQKIRNHTEFQVIPIGTYEFKNVDDPVEVYALSNPEIRVPDISNIEGKLKAQKKGSHRRVVYAVGLMLTLFIIAAIYLMPNEGRTTPDASHVTSIAVMPFKHANEDQANFLSTGIAEDILTQLAQIQGLRVIARSSSMQYSPGEDEKPYSQIAKELNVAHLLAGTVYQVDDVLKVNVKLVNPHDGSIIWAEDFQREFKDVLSVQQEIAQMVARQLKVRLTPHVKVRLQDKYEIVPEAYVNYLKGQEMLLRSSGSPKEVEVAKSYFEIAIQADSTFSKAWVGLADANLESIFWHRSTEGEALPKATHAAVTALKLDPDLGEAYAALGAVDIYSNNLKEAEKNLRHALELNPNCAFAHERLAWVHLYSGQIEESNAMLEKTILLDPLSTRYKGTLLNNYYFTERYDEGIARALEFLKLHPDDNFLLWTLAYLYAGKGDCRNAIETLDKRTIGRKTNWVYGFCHAQLGDTAAAQEVLDTLLARDARGFVPDFMIAVVYAAVGDTGNAIQRLEYATTSGGESIFAWGVRTDPMFHTLHDNPRFRQITDRIARMYENR